MLRLSLLIIIIIIKGFFYKWRYSSVLCASNKTESTDLLPALNIDLAFKCSEIDFTSVALMQMLTSIDWTSASASKEANFEYFGFQLKLK